MIDASGGELRIAGKPVKFGTCSSQVLAIFLDSHTSEYDRDDKKQLIWDMQAMLSEDGGALIPVFSDWLDAHRSHVKGHTPHSQFDLANGRLCEKVWLDA